MTKPYIERRYVTLSEDVDYGFSDSVSREWIADVDGRLTPTKEYIRASRSGATAASALEALRAALAEQGWELR